MIEQEYTLGFFSQDTVCNVIFVIVQFDLLNPRNSQFFVFLAQLSLSVIPEYDTVFIE